MELKCIARGSSGFNHGCLNLQIGTDNDQTWLPEVWFITEPGNKHYVGYLSKEWVWVKKIRVAQLFYVSLIPHKNIALVTYRQCYQVRAIQTLRGNAINMRESPPHHSRKYPSCFTMIYLRLLMCTLSPAMALTGP